jgi:hypothetical protein
LTVKRKGNPKNQSSKKGLKGRKKNPGQTIDKNLVTNVKPRNQKGFKKETHSSMEKQLKN